MIPATHVKLVEGVATLLCQEGCTHDDFFYWLAQEVETRGYTMIAKQRGVNGTHITIKLMEEGNGSAKP